MASNFRNFERELDDPPAVRGFLHEPVKPSGHGLVFTHGASGSSTSALLVALAESLAEAGIAVLRCDLPYRQQRPKGPPSPAGAARDREGLRRAAQSMREVVRGRVFLGGQSYGGRQATLLAAGDPSLAAGLLLTSYPLHPPGQPDKLRTAHLPKLQTPALFVHGSKDPFGTLEEMRRALALIPARHALLEIEGGGHGLLKRGAQQEAVLSVASRIQEAFQTHLLEGR